MVIDNMWFPVDNEALHTLFIVLLEKTITSTMMGEDVRVQTQVVGTGYEIAPLGLGLDRLSPVVALQFAPVLNSTCVNAYVEFIPQHRNQYNLIT